MWQKLSDEELEKQYNCSNWSHRMSAKEVIESHVNTLASGSLHALSTVSNEGEKAYGISEKEKLYIFGRDDLPPDAPVFVYIHGGYWQELDLESSFFMAPSFVDAGSIVVPLGYELAPKASLDEIFEQSKRALRYVMHFARKRGSRGVYIGGHSAGGHLAAMLMTVDWNTEFMESSDIIKGFIPVSGIYDLRPLVRTTINDALKMSEESAWNLSPMSLTEKVVRGCRNAKTLMVFGQHDPPEFHRQNNEFYQVLKQAVLDVRILKIDDADHFNVIERLAEPDYVVTKTMPLITSAYRLLIFWHFVNILTDVTCQGGPEVRKKLSFILQENTLARQQRFMCVFCSRNSHLCDPLQTCYPHRYG